MNSFHLGYDCGWRIDQNRAGTLPVTSDHADYRAGTLPVTSWGQSPTQYRAGTLPVTSWGQSPTQKIIPVVSVVLEAPILALCHEVSLAMQVIVPP